MESWAAEKILSCVHGLKGEIRHQIESFRLFAPIFEGGSHALAYCTKSSDRGKPVPVQ